MIRLTRVELRRLFARRLTQLGILGAVVGVGLMLFAIYQDARPPSEEELRQQRASYEVARAEWERNGEQMMRECRQQLEMERQHNPNAPDFCAQMEPRWETWGRPQAVFVELAPEFLLAVCYLVAFAAFLVGSGFVGAEFTSGSIGNWLTFEPRRLRVYASKLIAAGAGLAPVALVLIPAVVAGAWLLIRQYGIVDNVDSDTWKDLAGQGGRGVALTAAAAIAGAALAGLLRHTAAAVGVAMAYLVLVEGVFGGVLAQVRGWLLSTNVEAWIRHGTTYVVDRCTTDAQGNYNCEMVEQHLSFARSAAYLGVLMAALVLLGAVVFRRRDIT